MLKIRLFVGVLAMFISASLAPAIETVRVDASSGAPRIVVDGKPVRARVFFGAPGTRPLAIGPQVREVAFEFSPSEDEPAKATMHFRFGQTPGDVYLSDIQVHDVAADNDVLPIDNLSAGQAALDRSWHVWPPGKQNTVGMVRVEPAAGHNNLNGLHISIKAPADGHWPDFHIYHNADLSLRKDHRYRVSFCAKAEPARDLTVAFYRPGNPYVDLGGPPGVFEQQIKLAGAVGVNFVSFPMQLPWPKPGEVADFSAIDQRCRTVLDANPNALMIARIDVNPPAWWMAAHADDAMVWDGGEHSQVKASVASMDFRREAAANLAALVEHLENRFGANMAGYHPAGQNTDEWFYQDTWTPWLNGYSKCEEKTWRVWLTGRYHNDAALRAAWNDPAASLALAAIPSPTARRASPFGVFRDPKAERNIIDFGEFQQQAMADCVCTLAKATRQASHGRKLVLFFYGYVFELAAIVNGPATSGHYALRQVLDSPDIDVLCSPIAYFDRGLGQSAPAMTAAESVALAGKMYLEEDDTHTYLATGNPPGSEDHVDTLEKTNQELLRNTSQCGLRNFATWWMDLGATGWFNDPGMWEEMKRLSALDQPMLETPRPFHPEIAAVVDPRSMMRVSAGAQEVTIRAVYRARAALGHMGAPYGQYLLDDVLAGKVHAKVYVLLCTWCLDAEQRRQLMDATRGSVRIWCYAPGYLEDQTTALDGSNDLTSFRLRPTRATQAWATPTTAGKQLGLTQPFGLKQTPNPLFCISDATPSETLAAYGDGTAAIAMRKSNDGISLFVGAPGVTSELLRLAARQGNAHLYTQTDCNVCANGPYILFHASNPGPIEVDTGRPGMVRDMLNGRVIGTGPKIMLPIDKQTTQLLWVEDR